MKLNYKQQLFLYFAIILAIFTIGIVIFEQSGEKKLRTEALEEKLDAYAEIVNAALITHENSDTQQVLDSLAQILPQNIRLSLVDKNGNVIFDNLIKDLSSLQNHADRPEILEALKGTKGVDIRTSTSTNQIYLYYAKKYGNHYIRVALPYDIQTQRFLKSDNLFLYFILTFFVVMLVLINAITSRFSKSINQLHDFVMSSDKEDIQNFNFPKDELGEIGTKITENYRQLKESKKAVDAKREKLMQHVHSSEEGICFFSVDKKVEFYNGLFIQYLNILSDEPNCDPYAIFSDETFHEVNQFLSNKKNSSYFETKIQKQGKTFSLRINIFEDNEFEVILNDITKQEKTRQLKLEMTSNIAHELRTPVTSIRGYLETILEQPLDEQQKRHFVTQAYTQTIALSELIQDMGLITKIEEAPQSFKLENVDVNQLLEVLKNDFSTLLQERNIEMSWDIPNETKVMGNNNLLQSVFKNLIENTIRHAGENIKIKINLYKEDNDFYYFSFYDTGVGIPDEKHFNRLFERFYRINEGRTRDTGGTGLGLSIVRNAIAFHKGSITVKNRKGGGLEFLFQLHK